MTAAGRLSTKAMLLWPHLYITAEYGAEQKMEQHAVHQVHWLRKSLLKHASIANLRGKSWESVVYLQVMELMYSDYKTQVTWDVTTGVKQGCIFSPLLSILGMDRIMKKSTDSTRRGIRWPPTSTLEDYTDDIALVSHRHQDMQAKTGDMAKAAGTLVWDSAVRRPSTCAWTPQETTPLDRMAPR